MGKLSQLQFLDLYINQLSGSIPSSLGNLSQLQYLYLSFNQLTGSIPSSLGNLSQLQRLYLDDNQLSGDVPDFSSLTGVDFTIYKNYLNIAAGSQSLANIDAMIAAGVLVGYTPQNVLPPQLTMTRSGLNVILSWPTNATTFTLQSTTNLGSAAIWSTNSSAPVVVNGQNTVTNSISETRNYYRLSQ